MSIKFQFTINCVGAVNLWTFAVIVAENKSLLGFELTNSNPAYLAHRGFKFMTQTLP